jgi:glycosyltransferase involved in cell wall biosynthesis
VALLRRPPKTEADLKDGRTTLNTTWVSLRSGAVRPPITLVVCTYTTRRASALQTTISAVLDQVYATDEVVVVVDHNPELFDHVVFSLGETARGETLGADARVRVIANENARGLSGARNTGVSRARGEVVVFLDDDAIPHPGWLAQLTEPFADPEVIGTGGLAIPTWEAAPPDWLPEEFLWVVGCSYKGLPERPVEIRNPIGANMAFRRSVVETAGGFSDGLGRVGRTPLGCEETEFSIRATRTSGGRIIQQPTAIVDHMVTADRLRLRYFIHRCWAEGISKAVVSRLAGSDAALASERAYTTRTLPAGVARALRDWLSGDPAAFGRAAAIVGGLAVTVAGYLRGSASGLRPSTEPPSPAAVSVTSDEVSEPGGTFTPIWSGQLELAAPSLPERLTDADGLVFEMGRLLIRASGTPLGFVELEAPGGAVDLGQAVRLAQARFGDEAERALAHTEWMSDPEERVSVVISTHDRAANIRRAVESLQALKHRNLEIIVVDNAPSDETTLAAVGELAAADPRIRYVREEQKGASYGRNRGIREATCEIIAFADDDVRVDPLWIQGLLRGFNRRPDVACVTGMVASSSLARPAEQYFDQRVWWSSSCEPRTFTREPGPRDSPLHPFSAGMLGTGANFAVRASAVRSIGGFDQCLGAGVSTQGGEDLDLFVRLLLAGNSVAYEPCALVWHDHRSDDAALRIQMYAYGLGLTAYLMKYLLARRSRRALIRRVVATARHASVLLGRSQQARAAASLAGGGMTSIEVRGMLAGPFVYLRARRGQDPEHLRAVAP